MSLNTKIKQCENSAHENFLTQTFANLLCRYYVLHGELYEHINVYWPSGKSGMRQNSILGKQTREQVLIQKYNTI